jgi:hypothetical protein
MYISSAIPFLEAIDNGMVKLFILCFALFDLVD